MRIRARVHLRLPRRNLPTGLCRRRAQLVSWLHAACPHARAARRQNLPSTGSGDRGRGLSEEQGHGEPLDVGRVAWLACFGVVLYAPTNHWWFAFQERNVTAFKSRSCHAPVLSEPFEPLPCAHSSRLRRSVCAPPPRAPAPPARPPALLGSIAYCLSLERVERVHARAGVFSAVQTSRAGGPPRRGALCCLCALFRRGLRGVGGTARGFCCHSWPRQGKHLQAVGLWHRILGRSSV